MAIFDKKKSQAIDLLSGSGYDLSPEQKYLYEKTGRKAVLNKDKSISSERTITVEMDGKHNVLPTVVDGKQLSEDDAINYAIKNKSFFGSFDTPEEAQTYAENRSRESDRLAGGPGRLQKSLISDVAANFPERKPASDPRESLSPVQRLLTTPSVSKAIDFLSGVPEQPPAQPPPSPYGEIRERPFDIGMDVLRPTAQTLGLMPTPPGSRKTVPFELPQWLGVPMGKEQYKKRPPKIVDIPVSPQIQKIGEEYKKWTETPKGEYWTGGEAQEQIEFFGTVTLMTSLGVGGLKNLASSPVGQNLISKVANNPTLNRVLGRKISPDQIFKIFTKISRGTAGGKLTEPERKVWDAIQEAGSAIQAQKYGIRMKPFGKGGQIEIPKGLRLPSPAKVSDVTQFYAGAPIKFKPGQVVKLGETVYKISQIKGDTAQLISTAGNVASAKLSEISPPAKPPEPPKPTAVAAPEPKTPTQIETEKFTASQTERVIKQSIKQEAVKIKEPPTPKSEQESWEGKFELPPETKTEAFRRTVEDLNIRLKKVNDKIKEVSGEEVKEHLDIWAQKDMLPRKQSDQIRRVRKDKRGLVEKLVKDNVDVDAIDQYLHAKHAKERNAKMNEIRTAEGKEAIEGLSGMTDAEADTILQQTPQEFKKYDSMFRKMSDDLLDYEVENGLLKPEEAEKIKGTYEFYVPLFRDIGKESSIGIGQGIDIRGKEIKRAKGSKKRVISPIANLFHQQERARVRVLKNEIGKSIIKMTEEYPETKDLFEVKAQKYMPRFNKDGELQFLDPQMKLGDDVIGVKIDGKQYFVTIKDQKVAQALKNINLARSGALIRHMRAAIGLWSGLKTRWRPEFLITNFERDLGEALVNLGVEKERLGVSQKGLRRAIIKDLFPSQKEVWDYLAGKKNETVDEFFKLGGDTGHFWAENTVKAEKSLKQIEKEVSGAGSEKIVKHVRKAGEVIDNLNTMIELGVRYSTYKQLVERGFSKQRAVQSAADLTVNFSRQGEISPMLKAFYGFINPAIQGASKVIRSVATPSGKKKYSGRVVKGILSLMTLGFLTRAISSLIDDEGDEQIPEWSKSNKITIAIGNGKTVTLWSLPYGYSTFYATGSNLYETMAKRKTSGEALRDVTTSAVESFSPFGTSLNSLIPTLAKPIYEINQNKAWYDGPVYPNQVFTRTPSPDSEAYFKNTRKSAIFATSFLNNLTGGREGKAGLIDIHPNTLQYSYSQYLGGPFEFLTSSVEAGARGLKGEFDPNKTPFVRQVYRKGKPSQWSYRIIFDTLEIAAKKDLSQLQKDRFYRAVDTGLEEKVFDEDAASGYVQDFIRAQHGISGRILDNEEILGSMPKDDLDRLADTYSEKTQKKIKRTAYKNRKTDKGNSVSFKIWKTLPLNDKKIIGGKRYIKEAGEWKEVIIKGKEKKTPEPDKKPKSKSRISPEIWKQLEALAK